MRTALGAALACIAVLAAGPARAQPPVWVVSDADSELVVLGSIHVLPPGLDWRPPALTRAIAAADDLWFELPFDPASEAETGRLAVKYGTLPAGKSLFSLLSARDSRRLQRLAIAYGVSPAGLDGLQPWLAEVVLAGGVYRQAGAGKDTGVEKSLSAEAPASAARRAFETPAEQIAILGGAPMAEQIASLRQTMTEIEDAPDEYADLIKAWMAGDLKALDRQAIRPLRRTSPALFQRLVTERNVRWTQVLDARLKGRGRTVVVVGMGHLIGSSGLPARLRALGYKVVGPGLKSR